MEHTMQDQVTELDHIVRGVDKNNGLRGKIAAIEVGFKEMADRQRWMELRLYVITALLVGSDKVLEALL